MTRVTITLLLLASLVAKLSAYDPLGVLSIQAGQLLEKSGYKELEFWKLIPKDELKKMPPALLEAVKDPAQSGLDFTKPIRFYGGMDSELKLPKNLEEPLVWGWVTAPLKDANKMKGLIKSLEKMSNQSGMEFKMSPEETEAGTLYTNKDTPHGAFLITSNMLKVFVSNYPEVFKSIKGKKRKSKLPKPAEWTRGKLTTPVAESAPNPHYREFLKRKDDVSFYFDYQQFSNIFEKMKSFAEDDPEFGMIMQLMDSPSLKPYLDAKVTMGLNFENGAIVGNAQYLMEDNKYADMLGDGISKRLLDVLPSDPTMLASYSLKMGPAKKMVEDLYMPFLQMAMEDEEFNMDKPLPVVDISMNDLFAIPDGDIILYMRDVKKAPGPFPMPQVEFILGMTLNDRAKFDEVINKMTQPKGPKRGGPKMEIEQTLALLGMSLVRTDDAVFLCHNKFAREVEAGKSVKPISEKHRNTLASEYSSFYLNFQNLAKIAEVWMPPEVKKENEFKQALRVLRSMEGLEVSQNKNLRSQMKVTLNDKERNSLRILAGLARDAAKSEIDGASEVPVEEPVEPKPETDSKKPKAPKSTLIIPDAPPPPKGSTPYEIPNSKKVVPESDDFQKLIATFRGKISDKEKQLVGRWKGTNDTSQENHWEILQRSDRSFTMVIRNKDQNWEEVPVLHGAWRVDSGKLLYTVLQVENRHLPFSELKIQAEDVKTLNNKEFITLGEEDDGNEFKSVQLRIKRFESPRMWSFNNPESLQNFTFHIPPEPGR